MLAGKPYSQFPNSFEMQNGIPPEWIAVIREIDSESDLEEGEILFQDQSALDTYHAPYLEAKEAWNEIYKRVPNYGGFRVGMRSNPGYRRIFTESPILALQVENAISMSPDDIYWEVIKAIWNELINSLTNKPTESEIESFNQLATDNHIPLTFDADGKL